MIGHSVIPDQAAGGDTPPLGLPSNYFQLSEDEQWKARMTVFDNAQATPDHLVFAWNLLREGYLRLPRPGWYKNFKRSSALHTAMVRDIGTYSRNIWGAPRGGSKSTVMTEIAMTLALSIPNFYVTIIRATEKKARKHMRLVLRQFNYNDKLRADFARRYGEDLIPRRGKRMWSTDIIELPNGSTIESVSIGGALRGDRPDLIIIDDPEYDEDDADDSMHKQFRLKDLETLLINDILGMVEEGSSVAWIGTLISRGAYIYHIIYNLGEDERFKYWNRRAVAAILPDNSLLWKDKWEANYLRDRLLELGPDAFSSEYLNAPGASSGSYLKIHAQLCTYETVGAPQLESDPLSSAGELVYRTGIRRMEGIEYKETRKSFGSWSQSLYRLMLLDYAWGMKKTSDYCCGLIIGFDGDDILWVLDGFLDRMDKTNLLVDVWNLAYRWRVRMIGIEAVAAQKLLADDIRDHVHKLAEVSHFAPRPYPITYPAKLEKQERIGLMQPRFDACRIRLPRHRVSEYWCNQLWYQIQNFTLDLSRLSHDDAVDTLAMYQFVGHRKGVRIRKPPVYTVKEMLRRGEFRDPVSGLPNLSGINAGDLEPDILQAMNQRRLEDLAVRQPSLRDQIEGRERDQLEVFRSTRLPFKVLQGV